MMSSFKPELRSLSAPSEALRDTAAADRQPREHPPAPREASQRNTGVHLLLIAPESVAGTVAQALRQGVATRVQVVTQVRSGIAALRRDDYDLLVLEENLAASEPDATAALFSAANTAPVLESNFGLCSADRIVRQVRSALQRRAAEERKARYAVSNALVNELNASLAGLLLESQLALRGASPEVLPTLQHLVELATELRAQLRS